MQLPLIQTALKELSLLQTRWKSILDPFIAQPQLTSNILTNIALINGTTVVNHKLGHTLNGWKIVRQRADASIYDNQNNNQTPDITLVLVSNAAVVCDIEVF